MGLYKKMLPCMASVVALLALSGCSDDRYGSLGNAGAVDLRLDIDRSAISANPQGRSSLSELAGALTTDDFTISLTNDEGETSSWSYADFTGDKIRIGHYVLTASAGTPGVEGFDAPYFTGSTEIDVYTEKTTQAAVTAHLANSAVKVIYSEAFTKYASDYSASVRTSGSPDGVPYPADADGELFINPGEASLFVTFTTPQGKTVTLKAAEFTPQAQHLYNITIDINGGQVSDGVLSVSFDDTTVAETREFVLSDELINAPAPNLSPALTEVSIVEGDPVSESAKFNIMARGGIAEVNMTTTGAAAIDAAWPGETDLMKANDALRALLEAKGVKVMGLWKNPDKMGVVDFSGLLSKISSGDVSIRLEVVDRYGKVSETPAVLNVSVAPLHFSIQGAKRLYEDDQQAVLTVSYNGSNPATDIKWTYQNDRGTSTVAPVKGVDKLAMNSYEITVGVPAGSEDVVLTATAGSLAPVTYTVKRASYKLSVDPRDVFAKSAQLTLTSSDIADAAANSTYAISTDNGANWAAVIPAVSGNTLTLTGLTPATKYQLRAVSGELSSTAEFTTEAATQLTNSGLESYERTKGGSNWDFYVFEGWGTMNDETTSSVGVGAAYTCTSGTKPSTDCTEGSNAALIRTVGWGSGNTAGGSASIVNNVSAGQLYLGSFTKVGQSPNYGIAFASRPASISFQCKYAANKSDDFGVAEVYVVDASGNIIASNSINLGTDRSSYSQVTLPLTYAAHAPKAAKILVTFKSTGHASGATRSYLKLPGFAANAKTESVGGQLWIDQITLNY